MSLLLHILDRSIIHIFSSAAVYLLAYFGLGYAFRKSVAWTMRVLPALVAIGFIGWREAYDVAHGQPLLKAYTDYASWTIGMGLAIWGLQRFIKAQSK